VNLLPNEKITKYGEYGLIKVIYDKQTQIETINNVIDRYINEMKYILEHDKITHFPGFFMIFSEALDACILTYAAQYKDWAFHEEKEWRIIYIKPSIDIIDDLRFRESGRNIIPYVELDLSLENSPFGNKLPIAAIFQGPQSHPEIGKYSLSLLLKKLNYDDGILCKSSIPIRY